MRNCDVKKGNTETKTDTSLGYITYTVYSSKKQNLLV